MHAVRHGLADVKMILSVFVIVFSLTAYLFFLSEYVFGRAFLSFGLSVASRFAIPDQKPGSSDLASRSS